MTEFEIELLKQFKEMNYILKTLTATVQAMYIEDDSTKEVEYLNWKDCLQNNIDRDVYSRAPTKGLYYKNGYWKDD